ncbi:MAG TPA: orotidine-5'-phosphate decarboxylase [Betaproteobacteria bacterium]|nr:orotidine-5'-phosphate decarboxylase [Betaproteobacteria bacterium]
MTDRRIIVALDFPTEEIALDWIGRIDAGSCRLKVGKELFTAAGPRFVEQLMRRGFDVFLDLKFHDIPHTVAAACRAAASLGVWMVNVHALGGRRMMEAARDALAPFGQPPLLIAVTVLTSMAQEDLMEIGIAADPEEMVQRLARLAQSVGLDGVVCSAREAAMLRRQAGAGFCLVTPGIRPARAAADDQRRVMTPRQARMAGANYLVVGRPITQADDPLQALRDMSQAMENEVIE